MGFVPKGELILNGRTFVQRIAAALGDFPEKLVSVASCLDAVPDGFQRVPDLVPQIGPIGEFTLF